MTDQNKNSVETFLNDLDFIQRGANFNVKVDDINVKYVSSVKISPIQKQCNIVIHFNVDDYKTLTSARHINILGLDCKSDVINSIMLENTRLYDIKGLKFTYLNFGFMQIKFKFRYENMNCLKIINEAKYE